VTDVAKIVLTSALTVIGGSLVFVVQRFVLEPLTEQSKVLGRITYAMYYYGREYGFPMDAKNAPEQMQKRYWEIADHIRGLGASLAETTQAIRLRWLFAVIGMTPRRKHINEAIGLLTRMSNSLFAFNPEERAEQSRQNAKDADAILMTLGLQKWGK